MRNPIVSTRVYFFRPFVRFPPFYPQCPPVEAAFAVWLSRAPADGSGRFLAYSADPWLPALATRAVRRRATPLRSRFARRHPPASGRRRERGTSG